MSHLCLDEVKQYEYNDDSYGYGEDGENVPEHITSQQAMYTYYLQYMHERALSQAAIISRSENREQFVSALGGVRALMDEVDAQLEEQETVESRGKASSKRVVPKYERKKRTKRSTVEFYMICSTDSA